jgi:hypothetical protein
MNTLIACGTCNCPTNECEKRKQIERAERDRKLRELVTISTNPRSEPTLDDVEVPRNRHERRVAARRARLRESRLRALR